MVKSNRLSGRIELFPDLFVNLEISSYLCSIKKTEAKTFIEFA